MKGGMKSDDFRMKHQQGSSKENGLRMSANAARKAKVHGQRVIAMLYCIVILAIGLSITLFCTGQPVPENEPSFMGFFISMYLTSVAGMLYILGYIFQNRHASIEAIQKGNLSAPRILFSMRGEAVSLYLRIGVCIFAIMAIVFAACRAHELLLANGQLEYIIPYTVSRILFFIVQTVFLLLLHRLVMLAKVRLFSFIMLHLLTVNLCIWVEAAIEKVSHTIKGKHKIENYTMNTDHQKTSITGYFLPAVSEYCAIAVAVIYEMSQRIGQLKQIVAHHECSEEPSKTSRLKSCTGPIFGVFLSMLILALILILEMAGNAIDGVRTIIHLSEISSIHVMALLFCILGIAYVKRLKFSVNFAKSSLDEKLLLVTFFLAVNFFVVSIVLCIAYLTSGLLTIKEMEYMAAQLISTLLELIQAMVQTYFIHDMFYRCCHHKIYQQTKPGRTVIVILSALNFSLWMIYSFQVKHNDVLFRISWNKFQDADLRGLHMFVTVVLPMVMLFRYHSSVCLAISFVRIYEDEVTRYESMLRWLKQGTTKEFLHKLDLHLENSWMANEQGPPQISNSVRDQLQPGRIRSISQPILKSQLGSTTEPVNGNANKTNTSECSREKPREEKRIDPSRTRRDTQANFEMALIRVAAREAGHRMTEHRLRQQRLKEHSSPTAQEDPLSAYREPVRFYTGDNMEGISEITSEEDTSHSVLSATPKHKKNRNETNR